MDGRRVRHSRAVIPQKVDEVDYTGRPPLGLSEKNNGIPVVQKPRKREIPSRYKSLPLSPSRQRFPSPIVGHNSNTQDVQLPKRAQSADRRSPSNRLSTYSRPLMPYSSLARPSTRACDSLTAMHSVSRLSSNGKAADGLWPSAQRRSNSFCVDSSIKRSKVVGVVSDSCADYIFNASANAESYKNKTFCGRNINDLAENDWPMRDLPGRTEDEPRWSCSKEGKSSASTSLSCTDLAVDHSKSTTLSTPCGVLSRRTPNFHGLDGKLKSSTENKFSLDVCGQLKSESCLGATSTSCTSVRALPVTKPGRALSKLPHTLPLNKTLSESLSTLREVNNSSSLTRSLSPLSSYNTRTSVPCPKPSPFNYFIQLRKVKKGAKCIEDLHRLRMIYNRYLQWHFINALSEGALSSQKRIAEITLFNIGNVTSQLSGLVISKRIHVQHIKQVTKLSIILKEQIAHLEDWAAVENEHCRSLTGTNRALEASTLCLPVTGVKRVDIRSMKYAINSAMDLMQTMSSSLNHKISKLEQVLSRIYELLSAARKERAILNNCSELLALTEWLQVKESSLRVHMMQLGRYP
ncbi:hypothetical protein HPP92_017176 [Vanilla planifolia]|uniref:Uncharacterized protein n=1 Tax=Vanilla planifolia TaxID=51239 RepID=A0A835QGJ8_VANPL|nr:hypothetical protein HPP92_017176 [Vanilla planifolia]